MTETDGIMAGYGLRPGDRVEVRERFSGGWAHGFVVAGAGPDGIRLRRCSDGMVLPASFAATDVRPELAPRWR